ncbi:hypothetical protein LTS18_001865 [Coniosporium uncinatum]|uniref:Uncharacterized protein n=1 Tax=Coniosporium uncinatum TaxID=93489 RepID=A0ACC3DE84_9PEZI|nr:hypothetical protein LTS18_001865 [Coniosporium uncinatum]
MGKRKKASKPQGPKKRDTLPTNFQCLFCNHENSVSVKLEKKVGVGHLSCKVCGQTFQTGINYLSAAVDVYADWIDACDSVAKEAAGDHTSGAGVERARPQVAGGRRDEEEEEPDDFVVNDEDGEGEFEEDDGLEA